MAIDPRWIRGPADELAVEQGHTFDAEAGEFVCDFIERFCRQSKGRWRGQPLRLLDWQRDFLMRLFGWKGPDGTRRYRRAYLEVAKKNGKSTLVSGIGLYLLLADGEGAPEIYLNACDKDQASIIFEEQRRMVEASPDLKDRLQVINSQAVKRIVHPAGNGAIIANSSIAASKDGLNASGTIFDELHRQPDREMWKVFEYAGDSREQPLRLSITTAGEDEEGVWHEERDYAEKVNAGDIPDVTFLGVVYRALETDDIDDPRTWEKANPSLGETIRYDDFARALEEAKQLPLKLANFKRLKLNIIAAEEGRFLPAGAWNACDGPPRISPAIDRLAWAGLDLSTTTDISALAWLVGDSEGGFDLLMRFWLPEENIRDLEHRHRAPYRAWADQGFIILTPGSVIDYRFIRRSINELATDYSLQKLMIDPYNATDLSLQLRDEDGLSVEFIRQGFLSLSAPTKEVERLVLGGKVRHGGHPVMRWMAGNAVVERDAAGNIKLTKKKARNKIDGMTAFVNATAGRLAPQDEPSVYGERGILVL